MTTLTIRLPEDMAARLEDLARTKGTSMDALIEDMSRQALLAWDAESRFRARAGRADLEAARSVLDRLDRADGSGGGA
ncbi:CopG family transcriptional regulator [Roseospira navarrensis]|uniref:Ribbon-helix-helix protein, CopG family n=1 Tax=Roseospira navarrensis TaxID=140058 RepID=A0A7X1ZCS5_9PROT|nr:CopG family transcriptional regulator [Roseospira navarrensis]MQX35952.1 ribbon-helix-helix protein, CopG family [Roseospira navarrensis]